MMSSDHREHLKQQLAELLTVERARLRAFLGPIDGNNPADQADRAVSELDLVQVEARIQRLTNLLADEDRPVSATAGPTTLTRGALLTLDFGNGPETYRFSALDVDDGLDVVTPDSPLGRALSNATSGQRVTYRTPRGEASVTLVSVHLPAAA